MVVNEFESKAITSGSTIPSNSLGILADSRDVVVLNLITRPSRHFEDDLVQRV